MNRTVIEFVMGIKVPAFICARAIVSKGDERKQITIVSDEQYEDDSTFTFSKIKSIIRSMKPSELYYLKKRIYSADIIVKMVDEELANRHLPKNQKELSLKQRLEDKKLKELKLDDIILVRASSLLQK